MWLVAIIRKHQAFFFSLQPPSVKETKSGSIMFKKNVIVSCLQKHDSIMFASNLTVSYEMKCCHVAMTTMSAMQCHVCLKDGRSGMSIESTVGKPGFQIYAYMYHMYYQHQQTCNCHHTNWL